MSFQSKGFWMAKGPGCLTDEELAYDNSSRIEPKRAHQWFIDGSEPELFPNKKQAIESSNNKSITGIANMGVSPWENTSSFQSVSGQFSDRLFGSEIARTINFGGRNISSVNAGNLSVGRKGVEEQFGNDPSVGLSISQTMEDPGSCLSYGGIRKVKINQVKDSDNGMSVSMGQTYNTGDNVTMSMGHSFNKGDDSTISMGHTYNRGDESNISMGHIYSRADESTISMGHTYVRGDESTISMGHTYNRGNDNTISMGQSYSRGNDNTISMGQSYNRGDDNTISMGQSYSRGDDNTISMGQSYSRGNDNAISMGQSYSRGNDNTISIGQSYSRGNDNTISMGQTYNREDDNSISIGHTYTRGVENTVSIGHGYSRGDENMSMGQAYGKGDGNTISIGHNYNKGEEHTMSINFNKGEGSTVSIGPTYNKGDSNTISMGQIYNKGDNIISMGHTFNKGEGTTISFGGYDEEPEMNPSDLLLSATPLATCGTETVTKNKMELKMSKKVPPNNFPSNVKSLLSTGMLDGVTVKYISWSREKELRGVIKGSGYLCSCQSCNFSKALNAYEFERHAGCKTKHPNNHIFFENGKTIYGIVQELRSTPQNLLFEAIQTVTGSPINQKAFRMWKDSFEAATRELQRIYGKDELQQPKKELP
ncbi:hypothetical protein NE237_008397 [Protea cynaroides]|uniref:Tify domain-containing protein n=1 Tax=Protea cynaroides TaxID=273540 RepID=A0A9Q0KVJ4_9MAGN|nr:hypothetical protein NE237_008397 [Protea cynaroides]